MSARIVVAGASMAGLRAAEQLRAAGWTGTITLVGDEPHMPYNRPPLSKEVLAGKAPFESLAFRPRASVADVPCLSMATISTSWRSNARSSKSWRNENPALAESG